MRYFVVEKRLIASLDAVPSGEEITAEEYEARRQELYEAALEYIKNNPPIDPEEATEADYQSALRDMGVEV